MVSYELFESSKTKNSKITGKEGLYYYPHENWINAHVERKEMLMHIMYDFIWIVVYDFINFFYTYS